MEECHSDLVSKIQGGSVFFRKLFFLAFVTSMILFRTLLNCNLWLNPLSDVMGWLGNLGDCEWRTEANHRVH